jgi:branched-chain amino acid aminotransferase
MSTFDFFYCNQPKYIVQCVMNNIFAAWRNGTYCSPADLSLSILDLGVVHSDATYDVLAVRQGRAMQLDAHIDRLIESCHGWRLPVPYTPEHLKTVVAELVYRSGLDSAFVWFAVTRGVPRSGNPRDLVNCGTQVMAYVKPYYGFNSANTATLCLSTVPRTPDASINQRFKNWAWQDLTQAQWQAIDRGYNSAVLLDHNGHLTEGPGFNVAVVIDDIIHIPQHNVLGGITMATVVKLCEANHIPYKYSNIDQHRLEAATDMFITSTAGDIVSVSKFESTVFTPSDQQVKLKQLIQQAWTQDEYSTLLSRTI